MFFLVQKGFMMQLLRISTWKVPFYHSELCQHLPLSLFIKDAVRVQKKADIKQITGFSSVGVGVELDAQKPTCLMFSVYHCYQLK